MITRPAAGSITSCRDVNNQAVFVLKGKPLNVSAAVVAQASRTSRL